jgi:predicted unusual protein kinase regulating ubiquinone biosynthesis (AarF/ABC1/UbiB family)
MGSSMQIRILEIYCKNYTQTFSNTYSHSLILTNTSYAIFVCALVLLLKLVSLLNMYIFFFFFFFFKSLLPDGSLGLIDYGIVGRLTLEERLKVAQVIVALANDNLEEVCVCMNIYILKNSA